MARKFINFIKLFLVLTILIFCFQSFAKADDIRDFEIEGMSIGDSLLDYVSKDEIEKKKKYFYKSKEYASMSKGDPSFETYGGFQAHFKDNDKKYIIQTLKGMILYKDNIKDCYKKQNEIVEELTDFIEDAKKSNEKKIDHSYDKSGKSKITYVTFTFNSGDFIEVACVDWSKELPYNDKLYVLIMTKKIQDWINKDLNY